MDNQDYDDKRGARDHSVDSESQGIRDAGFSKIRVRKRAVSPIAAAIGMMIVAGLNLPGSVFGRHLFEISLVVVVVLMGVSVLVARYKRKKRKRLGLPEVRSW